jgi:hypothetical protein
LVGCELIQIKRRGAAAKRLLSRVQTFFQHSRGPFPARWHIRFGRKADQSGPDPDPDREEFGPILHIIRYRADELEKAGHALAAKAMA